MFKDEARDSVWEQVRQRGLQAFAKVLTPLVMHEAAQVAKVRIGKSALNACTLVWLGITSALHTTKNFADVLAITLKLLEDAQCQTPRLKREPKKHRGKRSKHNPHGTSGMVSEEAFVQARQKLPPELWMSLVLVLAENFQRQQARHVRWKRFRLLMLDGSDIALPPTPTW